MVYHCTAYSKTWYLQVKLLLASSHIQRVKCKELTQGDGVHCTLGNFNHPIYLQRSGFEERKPNKQHLNLQTCWITQCLPTSLTCSYKKKIIHKARIVKEGGGITFFARDYWYNRWDTGWRFFGVNALFEGFTCLSQKTHPSATKGTCLVLSGRNMCKICSKAKWQCCKF